ncbi:MAG: DUF6516 family protein [Chloroflexi bacterium]|nr:DUF6516 family protein [Chloroflexota bacterium]
MRVEAYFDQLRRLIEASLLVASSNVAYDKRSTHEGFVQGELYFVDGSVLHVREYVDVETSRDRLMYVYQYMDAAGSFVFRYDNTGHHKKLRMSTYPHHKHEGDENKVIAASAPDLATVLDEIEPLIRLE